MTSKCLPGFTWLVGMQGYALIEFETKKEAETAIKEMDGQQVFQQEIHVDWAFVKCTYPTHRPSSEGCDGPTPTQKVIKH